MHADRRIVNERRDEGAVLPLVLVMMVISALIVIPLLSYSVSVLRANTVVGDSTRQREAAEGGLRVALLDPTGLFTACGGGSTMVTEASGVSINGTTVSTSCSLVDEVGPLNVLGFENPIGSTATQLGADVPEQFIGTRNAEPHEPHDLHWWGGTPTATDDQVWLPTLPTAPGRDRAGPFTMPPAFDCTVYLPGRYADPISITSGNVYFASGVYYFEQQVMIGGNANVVVGYGLADLPTDCADDVQVGANLVEDPGTFEIDGAGATWVLGADGRVVIDNSDTTTGLSVRFNQRYAQVGYEADRGQRVSIMSVNGDDDSLDDHVVPDVVEVPRSMATVGQTAVELGTPGADYLVSSPRFTSEPRAPQAPTGFAATAYTDGTEGSLLLAWDEVTGQGAGGALIDSYAVTSTSAPEAAPPSICEPSEIVAVETGRLGCAITGLTIDQPYTFQVAARNTAGIAGAATEAVVVVDADAAPVAVPAQPDGLSVDAYDSAAEVSWVAGDTAGLPITNYHVRAQRVFLEPQPDDDDADDGDSPVMIEQSEDLDIWCETSVAGWKPAPTSCFLTELPPLEPTDVFGNPNIGYRFVVTATNALGQSDEAAIMAGLSFEGPEVPTPTDPEPRVVEAWVPEPIVELNLAGAGPTSISIPGYVSVPMGRVSVDNPNGHDVRLIGGLLASTIHLDEVTASGGPESTTIGYQSEIVLQRKIRLVAAAGGTRASAVVQINEDGNFAVNSWVVQ